MAEGSKTATVRDVKPMRGGRGPKGPAPKVENPGKILKRLIVYVFAKYKIHFAAVIVCILLSSLMTLRGTWFMQSLIDDYIIPLTKADNPDFGPLAKALFSLALTYGIGIVASYIYNRIMINISQGTMKKLRIDILHIWSPFRLSILIRMRTVILCRFIPMTWIRCAS